jgi:hypothetical protein
VSALVFLMAFYVILSVRLDTYLVMPPRLPIMPDMLCLAGGLSLSL